MDCKEFQELISEAVDDRLRSELMEEFALHATRCLPCRNEFEVDRLTKNVVRRNIHRQEVPSDLYYSVLSAVRTARSSPRHWMNTIFGSTTLNPAVALVALVIAVLGSVTLLQRDNAVPLSNERNIISQSLSNYSAAMTGALKPTLVSHDAGDVKDFLGKDAPFEVSVASISGCDWCGGVLSNFEGVRLAHVVYKIGGQGLLYVYQVDMDEAIHGNKIGLPENAKASLAKTGWYFEQTGTKCNIILWKHNNTLCAAVSTIDRDSMIALMSEKSPW